MKFNIKLKRLYKYVLFGLVIVIVLKYFSGASIKSSNILTYTLLILISIIIIDRYIFKQTEYMSTLSTIDDLNDNSSNYFITENKVSYNEAKKLLNNKKQKYIMDEYINYISYIPIVQVGKDRNYLDLEHNH